MAQQRVPYLGDRTKTGSRVPYLGDTAPSPPEHHGGGGGVLGFLGHLARQTGVDLYHTAVDAPAGLYHLGGGLIHDPLGTVKQVGRATLQDFEHPLRHPGYTLLDLLGGVDAGASTIARLGEAGRVASEGAKIGEIGKTLLHNPTPPPRELKIGNAVVDAPASRSFVARNVQKGSDTLLARAHEANPDTRLGKAYTRRVGRHNAANQAVLQAAQQGPAAALQAIGKGLKPAERHAIQSVALEATPAGQIAAHRGKLLSGVKPLEAARHTDRISVLQDAAKLLTTKGGKPVFKEGDAAAKLQPILDHLRTVATSREDLLRRLDLLSPEAMAQHKTNALRDALGVARDEAGAPPPHPGQLSLIDTATSEGPVASAEAINVPDVKQSTKMGSLFRGPRIGAQGTIGRQQKLGSLKENTGYLKATAQNVVDPTRTVAQASLALSKFHTGERLRTFAQEAGHMVPNSADDVFVRGGKLGAHEPLPAHIKDFVANPQAAFNASPAEGASKFGDYLKHVFVPVRDLSGDQVAEYERLAHAGMGTFVNKRALGDYAKSQAPLKAVAGSAPVGVLDAINNASRAAIFYGKPAYAAPNMLGNTALNVIQQGFAAVPNITRAARLNAHLGVDSTARIDTLMGEGFAQSVSGHEGIGTRGIQAAANFWSKGVDRPFRRASFLYEAKRAGYSTPAQIEKLLTDPAHEQQLVQVTRRANRSIIDYASMSPVEKEIIRRIVFVYPWIRGSSGYAVHFLGEHPVQAAATGQLAKQGEAETAKLGPTPSYLEGAFKMGGGLVSPNSAAILQTPAQVASALAGLATGNVNKASQLSSFLTPAAGASLAEITRRDSTGKGYKGGTNAFDIAKDQLTSALPQVLLYQRLRAALTGEPQSRKLYPSTSILDAVKPFVAGGIVPRRYNPNILNALARREKTHMKSGR